MAQQGMHHSNRVYRRYRHHHHTAERITVPVPVPVLAVGAYATLLVTVPVTNTSEIVITHANKADRPTHRRAQERSSGCCVHLRIAFVSITHGAATS